ncbi:MAG: pilus assembly protein PilM, partial [Bdellovibrionia bacterium]
MRILGIDLGSSSVKAVEMESAFGRFEVRDYYEQVIAPHETQKEALFRLLEGLPKAPDRVILGLCNGQSTFRILELPTRDRKAIQSAVGFELEDDLPFALDESTLQYSILSQNKQGSSLYVSITLKKYLAQALETWEDARFSPDVITPEEWAYRALINRIQASSSASEHPLLVVIGHQKTVFYLQDEQTPRVISEVTWGGRDLTQAISQAQNLSWDEAEKMKLNHGILLPENPPADTPAEQQELSACLARACGRLPEWIKKIDLIARSLTQREITSIYLSGGTALLPGLGAWLEQQLQMPVKPLRALSQLTSSGIVYSEETDARFLLASALSLASMSLDRIPCINLRKDEFAKAKRERKLDLRMYSKPLLSVGAIVMSLFISLTVQSMVYQSRLKATNAQLDK